MASPHENAHTFARLSLILHTLDTPRIENIPDAEAELNAEMRAVRLPIRLRTQGDKRRREQKIMREAEGFGRDLDVSRDGRKERRSAERAKSALRSVRFQLTLRGSVVRCKKKAA